MVQPAELSLPAKQAMSLSKMIKTTPIPPPPGFHRHSLQATYLNPTIGNASSHDLVTAWHNSAAFLQFFCKDKWHLTSSCIFSGLWGTYWRLWKTGSFTWFRSISEVRVTKSLGSIQALPRIKGHQMIEQVQGIITGLQFQDLFPLVITRWLSLLPLPGRSIHYKLFFIICQDEIWMHDCQSKYLGENAFQGRCCGLLKFYIMRQASCPRPRILRGCAKILEYEAELLYVRHTRHPWLPKQKLCT